jgi:superfamily II DNA/RNA helicase
MLFGKVVLSLTTHLGEIGACLKLLMQTLMFSATFPSEIQKLAVGGLHPRHKFCVVPRTPPPGHARTLCQRDSCV